MVVIRGNDGMRLRSSNIYTTDFVVVMVILLTLTIYRTSTTASASSGSNNSDINNCSINRLEGKC